MSFTFINPESLGAPHGYSNGVLTEGGRLLFISGQIAWDQQQQIVSADLVDQFDRALANVIAVVNEAGGGAEQIARLVIYVTDKNEYRKRLKAITFEVYRELTDMFAALRDENDVRVVVITGAGRAFCSGGDVRDIIGELQGRDAEGLLEFTRLTCELIGNMRALPKPIIASLNGTTAGAGACIALASDLRIAATEAKIAFIFVKVGLAGTDMGATYLLPRVVGLAKATELLMTGDFVEANEAERIGLYNRVVPRDQLESATREFAEKLASGPAP